MKFEAEKGEHFFRSTLVQTLFYGVFSAWVLWHKEKPQRKNDFDWKSAAWTLHVPMIKALFEQVATPTKLGPLGLVEVLDWTAAALNRVDRAANSLRALSKTTPSSISTNRSWKPSTPNCASNWACGIRRRRLCNIRSPAWTPRCARNWTFPTASPTRACSCSTPAAAPARISSRCCGTLHKISERRSRHGRACGSYIKKAAQERVFGFELLPAPFVVAHLQMGLLLQNLGVPLDDAKRARRDLSDQLAHRLGTADGRSQEATRVCHSGIQAGKEAADDVKQEKTIIVILGNPPYNGFAGSAVEEEQGLVERLPHD